MAELKKDWVLSHEALQRLLHWLDEGGDSSGERYIEVRRRLTAYFDRRNCFASDDLADETLNRVARKLEEKGEIVDATPAHYCYIVARLVFLESSRRKELHAPSLDSGGVMASLAAPSEPATDTAAKERLFNCLERCLNKLRMEDRQLVLEYYRGEQRAKIEHRAQMALHFGLTRNALGIRACRIRTKLEACVKGCSDET